MKRLALLAVAAAAAITVAQTPTPPPAASPANRQPPTANSPGHYIGVASCVNSGCHGSTQPLDATRVLQNEYYTWLNDDKHARAYAILFDARSARIAKNMRLKKKAYEEALCLDCHTSNIPATLVDPNIGNVDVEDGIQCEVCHGPASGWLGPHTEEGWTHEQSVAAGMIDLRRISTRGMACAGCHIGNAKKEVDHELIASGHPILGFELDNYTESMPPHWALKYEGGRESHGVRAWAVGQVVKFRESLDNLARHARGDEWPEFSEMSCYNCHHDLENSQWRQERGWPERAGLPAWSPQHWAMMRLLIGRVSPQSRDELEPLVRQISRGVSRMNEPQSVATNADRARRIVESLVPRFEARAWTDADVRAMMTTITNDRDFILTSDVHAAEQAALALQSLSSVLTRRDARLLRSNMTRAIDALFGEIENRDDYEPARFVEKLNAVRAAI